MWKGGSRGGTCRMPQGLGKHAAGGEKFLCKNALKFKIDHRKSPKIDNFSKKFRLRHVVSLNFNNNGQKFSRAPSARGKVKIFTTNNLKQITYLGGWGKDSPSPTKRRNKNCLKRFSVWKITEWKKWTCRKVSDFDPRREGVNRMPKGNFLTTPFFMYETFHAKQCFLCIRHLYYCKVDNG